MNRLKLTMAAGAVAALAVSSVATGGAAQAATAGSTLPGATAATGSLTLVQAVPGSSVGASIDGKSVQDAASTGSVLGPYSLSPGAHTISFSDVRGATVSQKVMVRAGGSRDVVLHLPESVSGDPELNVYNTPTAAIGPQKSRVLVAHTANLGAAAVAFDGTVVFNNVTNGQFADADIPSGAHQVQMFPAGEDTKAALGPLSLTLPAGTVTMAYAYGDPANKSMKVVSHTERLSTEGTAAPTRIHTGAAGLAGAVPTAFGLPGVQQGVAGWVVWLSYLLALPTLALLGVSAVRRNRGTAAPVVVVRADRRRMRF